MPASRLPLFCRTPSTGSVESWCLSGRASSSYGTDAVKTVGIGAEVFTSTTTDGIAIWDVEFDGSGAAVAVLFGDGTGTVLPVLRTTRPT